MPIKPFAKMVELAEENCRESELAYFNSLMYYGEMLTKFSVAGLVAAVKEGRNRHQYSLKHRLVRATGIGEWREVLDEILTGVAAQHLSSAITGDGDELSQLSARSKSDAWQYKSVLLLHSCLELADPEVEPLPRRVMGKTWFSFFARLRNKTRGHGALPSDQLVQMCPDLRQAIDIFASNFKLYQRPWAYMQDTLKGKYHVIRWNEEAEELSALTTRRGGRFNFLPGVYILFGDGIKNETLRIVDLIQADVDDYDYFVPNGGWTGKKYSLLSYTTGISQTAESKPYMTPVADLPPSNTEGQSELFDRGSTTVNLPPPQLGYIGRPIPERQLYRELVDDNQHRLVTLVGSGGVGKTWLTLQVLDKIAAENKYDAILWFSSRDIDLLSDGVAQVKPRILDENHIAEVFAQLIGQYMLSYEELKSLDPLDFLRRNLSRSDFGKILFVFDNFETVNSPVELFYWIENFLRLPNRALITTRFREFNGDNPVELDGMSFDECKELIRSTATRLGIEDLITSQVETDIYSESDGHPYIVKMLLAETKRAGNIGNFEKMMVRRDDLLDILFERTYNRLSLVAKRVFLTLCSWKSLVAETAIEAVLLRPGNELRDIADAFVDLYDSSLIEKQELENERETYWSVPLAARLFGLRKLEINSMQLAIEHDKELLLSFGATQEADVRNGHASVTRRLFKNIERQIATRGKSIEDYLNTIEFVAKRYPEAWLKLANLYRRLGESRKYEDTLLKCTEYAQNDDTEKALALQHLVRHYSSQGLHRKELSARIQQSRLANSDIDTISQAANHFNRVAAQSLFEFDEGEKWQSARLLIDLMEGKFGQSSPNATDYSRLGWLYMHVGEHESARESAQRGLVVDPDHDHCASLKSRALDAIQSANRTLI